MNSKEKFTYYFKQYHTQRVYIMHLVEDAHEMSLTIWVPICLGLCIYIYETSGEVDF